MSDLFISVLNMSLKASYVIILLMLIRLLLKKAPKFISYALWGVVAFRLIIPFTFESIFSIVPEFTNTNPMLHDIVYQEEPEIESGIELVDSIVDNVFPEPSAINSSHPKLNDVNSSLLPAPNVVTSVNPIQIYVFIGSCIWFLGIVVLLVYSLVSVIRLKKRLKDSQLLEDNIFEANNLKTPFVLGVIKPKIYLPAGLKTHERDYIILHEQTHIRRQDHVIKIMAFIILSIHWFNPIVWIAFVLMSTDMELSCDEQVLREMNEDVKKPYANSLLSLAMGGYIINASPLAFGEGNVKGRIKNVLNYKKPSFWMIIVSIIFVGIISIALITNPRQEDPIQKDEVNIENSNHDEENVSENLNNQDEKISEDPIYQEDNKAVNPSVKTDEVYQTEYNRVKIKLASDMMGFKATNEFETTNYRMVAYIDLILRGGERV